MGFVEPGEPFVVQYGNGREVDAVGLSFRQERLLAKAEDDARSLNSAESVWEHFEKVLPVALPHKTEEQIDQLLDTLNLRLLQELIKGVLQGQKLSEDDRKKEESSH